MLFLILGTIIILLPIAILVRSSIAYMRDKSAIHDLTNTLFPNGDSQCEAILDNLENLTNHKYHRGDLLDYYLKIKGLQIIDIQSYANSGVRNFLMKPTKIRLSYMELVKFYEEYLNFPQAIGIDYSEIKTSTSRQK